MSACAFRSQHCWAERWLSGFPRLTADLQKWMEKPVGKRNTFSLVCSRWVLMVSARHLAVPALAPEGQAQRCEEERWHVPHPLLSPLSAEPLHWPCHWALDLPQLQSCLAGSWGMVCSLPVIGYFIFRAFLRVIEKYTAACTPQKSSTTHSVVPLCSAATSSRPSQPPQEQQPRISALRLNCFLPRKLIHNNPHATGRKTFGFHLQHVSLMESISISKTCLSWVLILHLQLLFCLHVSALWSSKRFLDKNFSMSDYPD